MDLALVALVMVAVMAESHIRLLIWRKNGLKPLSWRARLCYTLPAFIPALAMLMPPVRLPIFYLLFFCCVRSRNGRYQRRSICSTILSGRGSPSSAASI